MLFSGHRMLGSIALIALLALFIGGVALRRYWGRRSGERWRLLRDLSPVSEQWLADRRRSR